MQKPFTLKNGLKVITLPEKGANNFIIGFIVSTGSSIENRFHPGVSHLVEKLFHYGTDKHPSQRHLNTALDGMGAKFYSETTHELTHYYIIVPSYHQYKAISVLSDIIQHSYFDEKDTQKEKNLQIEALSYLPDSQNINGISQLALDNLYYSTPLSFPLKGSIDSLVSINRNNVINYIDHQYKPSTSYLILSGGFEPENIIDLINQEWGYWNPKNKPYQQNQDEDFNIFGQLPRVMYKQKGQSHTDVALTFYLDQGYQPNELLKTDDTTYVQNNHLEKVAQVEVLNTILGRSATSRLWTKTVEDEMFFNNIYSSVVYFKNTAYLQIAGVTSNTQFTFALESILASLDALKQTTVSINEMAKAKEYLKGMYINDHDDLFYKTYWQACNYISSGLTYSLNDILDKINKVDAASIRSLALDLFIPERMTITTVGTAKETKIVDNLIKRYLA
jgi:predicted Zn-dependent peptidase